jgi:hypothetical protein
VTLVDVTAAHWASLLIWTTHRSLGSLPQKGAHGKWYEAGKNLRIALALTATLCLSRCQSSPEQRLAADPYSTWQVYGGNPANIHYSTLHQINRTDVGELKPVWTYDTGDAFKVRK